MNPEVTKSRAKSTLPIKNTTSTVIPPLVCGLKVVDSSELQPYPIARH
jgi:hypothetical protein